MTLNFRTNFRCNRNVTALFRGKFQKRTHLPGKDYHSSLTVMARLCQPPPARTVPDRSLTNQPAGRKTRDPLWCDGTNGWHWVRRCGTGIEGIHIKAATAGPGQPPASAAAPGAARPPGLSLSIIKPSSIAVAPWRAGPSIQFRSSITVRLNCWLTRSLEIMVLN